MGMEFLKFCSFELSKRQIGFIKRFMRLSGLVYGCMDLIIDGHGNTWFLECNQNGAWAWLDDLANGKISEAFCRLLLSRARESRGVMRSV